jgi:uncharacterized protein YcbK (DUF882 family)
MYGADLAREFVKHAITPTSACRCAHHNALIGGVRDSQHVLGRAIDLPVRDPKALYDYLCEQFPDSCGIGLYEADGFVHFDDREEKARWVKN